MTEGIKAEFTGTVTRTFGIGFAVDVPSGKYPQRVTVFTKDLPADGATVTVSGILTQSKDKPWTDKEGNTRESWSLKINDATVTSGAPQTATQAPQEGAPWDENQWGTAPLGEYDSSTPF